MPGFVKEAVQNAGLVAVEARMRFQSYCAAKRAPLFGVTHFAAEGNPEKHHAQERLL